MPFSYVVGMSGVVQPGLPVGRAPIGSLCWEEGGYAPPVSPQSHGQMLWGRSPMRLLAGGLPGGLLPEQGEGGIVLLWFSPSCQGQAALAELLGEGREFAGCNTGQKPPGLARMGRGLAASQHRPRLGVSSAESGAAPVPWDTHKAPGWASPAPAPSRA